MANAAPETVMIYSMGEVIGDGLIKLPWIAALRDAWPQARITWCAAKGGTVYAGPLKPVVEGMIDEVLTTPPTGANLLDHIRGAPFGGRRFDVVIDTQSNLMRALYARRAAKSVFVSAAGKFAVSGRRPPADRPWPAAMLDRLGLLLELAHGSPSPLRPIGLANPRALDAARALLPGNGAYIGLAPGAGGQDKRWPLERYIALAETVSASGQTPVFFFGPDERDDAEQARVRAPYALFPELERTDDFRDVKGPLLVIALATRLKAAVANDAGPGHMLAAGGAPLLSLQRRRDTAVKFRPTASRLSMIVAEDYGAQDMTLIPLDDVRAALEALIA